MYLFVQRYVYKILILIDVRFDELLFEITIRGEKSAEDKNHIYTAFTPTMCLSAVTPTIQEQLKLKKHWKICDHTFRS